MVVANQVQRAVDHQVGPVSIEALALLPRLALDHLRADHDVAKDSVISQRRRKGQDVGRVVATTPAGVQSSRLGKPDDAQGELGAATSRAKRRACPFAQACGSWCPDATGAPNIDGELR